MNLDMIFTNLEISRWIRFKESWDLNQIKIRFFLVEYFEKFTIKVYNKDDLRIEYYIYEWNITNI